MPCKKASSFGRRHDAPRATASAQCPSCGETGTEDEAASFLAGRTGYWCVPVAEGEEPVEIAVSDLVLPATETELGWPVLSDLELDVCVSESGTPGLRLPRRLLHQDDAGDGVSFR